MQKWIMRFGNGPEAFAEWRRLGHPQLQAGPDAANHGRIPIRLPHPERELRLNGLSVAEAVPRPGGTNLMGLNITVCLHR